MLASGTNSPAGVTDGKLLQTGEIVALGVGQHHGDFELRVVVVEDLDPRTAVCGAKLAADRVAGQPQRATVGRQRKNDLFAAVRQIVGHVADTR